MSDNAAERVESEVELTIVTLRFDATDDASLLAVLSKYIVLTRMQDGCRNVDLCSSVTVPGRHLVVQKWETPEHQRRQSWPGACEKIGQGPEPQGSCGREPEHRSHGPMGPVTSG